MIASDRKETYTWNEVLTHLKAGSHDTFFIPHQDEYKGEVFERNRIPLSNIEDYTTYEEFHEIELWHEIEIIEGLIRAYRNHDPVPPIVLDSNYKIIDGYHRLPAQHHLRKEEIEVYIRISS